MDLEEEWELFQVNDTIHSNDKGNNTVNSNTANREDIELNSTIPKCEDLYISTKTKVLFLNQGIDIYNVFWNIPVILYSIPKEGVVKNKSRLYQIVKWNTMTIVIN